MESIHNSNVWDLVELPTGKRLVGNKWVFKRKLKPDGFVEQFKARLDLHENNVKTTMKCSVLLLDLSHFVHLLH